MITFKNLSDFLNVHVLNELFLDDAEIMTNTGII